MRYAHVYPRCAKQQKTLAVADSMLRFWDFVFSLNQFIIVFTGNIMRIIPTYAGFNNSLTIYCVIIVLEIEDFCVVKTSNIPNIYIITFIKFTARSIYNIQLLQRRCDGFLANLGIRVPWGRLYRGDGGEGERKFTFSTLKSLGHYIYTYKYMYNRYGYTLQNVQIGYMMYNNCGLLAMRRSIQGLRNLKPKILDARRTKPQTVPR